MTETQTQVEINSLNSESIQNPKNIPQLKENIDNIVESVHNDLEKKSENVLSEIIKANEKYKVPGSDYSSEEEELVREIYITPKSQKKVEIEVPNLKFSNSNSNQVFDDVHEMVAYYNKHKSSLYNLNTQRINKLLQCEGYKFSKISGEFNIIATDTSSSNTSKRETWKNKAIELEKSIQTLQINLDHVREDIEMLTSKLIKAYNKISFQTKSINDLNKIIETQIPSIMNKINKLKAFNNYLKGH